MKIEHGYYKEGIVYMQEIWLTRKILIRNEHIVPPDYEGELWFHITAGNHNGNISFFAEPVFLFSPIK